MNFKHVFFYKLLRLPVKLFLFLKFGYRSKTAKNLPENYIVLSNHVTDYDPLFVGVSFPRQMYIVASEHIARWKVAFKLLNFGFAPIIRPKGAIAASTVKNILLKVRKGNNVCIFAEGARSWDGITGPILPATGQMIKFAKCGLVTYKITGGYFVSPNWSQKNMRRGPISGAPVGVYTKEDIEKMTIDELNAIINRDLFEDAYARQLEEPKKYKGKDLAKHMENLLFYCPKCGKMETITSEKDTVSCTACGFSFKYNEYGMLEGAPFETVRELFAWQKEKVAEDARNNVTYVCKDAKLSTVHKHVETIVAEGEVRLSREGFSYGNTTIPMEAMTELAMHGRHAVVFSAQKNYYELLPQTGNTLKFHLLFDEYKKMVQE